MIEWGDIVDKIGILGTLLISTLTYFGTQSLQQKQQRVSIMATKRSERIDLMREYSSGIISCGKQIYYNLATSNTKSELICYVDKFNSLLQYAYPHDIDLIDYANHIADICLDNEINTAELKYALYIFWKECDRYVGAEYERLKNESIGNINKSGALKCEEKSFEDIYQDIKDTETKVLAEKARIKSAQQPPEE